MKNLNHDKEFNLENEKYLKRSFFISVCFLLSGLIYSQSAIEQPNIILINIDDLGWKDVGFMGSPFYKTPHLDLLASKSRVFKRGYAAASNCAPSRATIMTGQWTPRHGVFTVSPSTRGKTEDRKLIPIKNSNFIPEESVIFPQLLEKVGYILAHAGKWHISESPLDFGFDVNIGGSRAGHPKSYYPPYKNVDIPNGKFDYLTDRIMEHTVHFIDTVQSHFFLNYAPYAVHTPIQAVDSLVYKYKTKKPWNDQQNAAYATMVENVDRNIGLLLDALQNKGIMNNTLIVFTSDNGGLEGITDQYPLRSGKGSYYEGGIRVPFFFYWEGYIPSDIDSSTLVSHIDLYPTLLDAAGIPTEELSFDGESLMPYLQGKTTQQSRKLFFHFPIYLQANRKKTETRDPLFRTRPGSVVIDGAWKLIYYFEEGDSELFNLEMDVSESKDLSTTHPVIKANLLSVLENWWKETDAPIPTTINPEYGEQ